MGRRLEPGRHLPGVQRVDAGVVGTGHEQDRGIGGARPDVMVGRIGVKRLELGPVLDRSVFRDVEGAVGGELVPEHVVDADATRPTAWNRSGCWVIIAPISSPPFDPPMMARRRGPGVAPGDEMLHGRGEVVEDVLLLGQRAGPVPLLAELAAAAGDGHGVDHALLDPDAAQGAETGGQVDPVSAVAVEHGGGACRRAPGPWA